MTPGAAVLVAINGQALGVAEGLAAEMTEEDAARRAASSSASRFKTVLGSVHAGVRTLDPPYLRSVEGG